MPDMHFVVTGATGYVGKHLVARLLDQGHRVSAITRAGSDGADPAERVLTALEPFTSQFAAGWRRRLRVVAGDVTMPDCGIDAAALRALRRGGVQGFIHSAALTRFEQRLEAELTAANVDGTAHAVALNARIGGPHFHHISTAFVTGTTPYGEQRTAAADRSGFNNPYEASKYAAEKYLVLGAGGARVAGISIYRPSIVVGGYPLGEGGSVSTVYTFIKAMNFLRECYRSDTARGGRRFADHGLSEIGGRFHMPIRVAATRDKSLNLVSIDALCDAVVHRLAAPLPPIEIVQLSGQACTLLELRNAFCGAMDISGPMLVPPDAFDSAPRNPVEAHFHRITRDYQPYLLGAPDIESAPRNNPAGIDLEALTMTFLRQLTGEPDRGGRVGSMAIELHGINRARDYFDALTRNELARHFLRQHRFVDAAVRFRIRGAEIFDEVIVFGNGSAAYAPHGSAAGSDCCYELDEALFLRCITGRADLRNAFFAGKVLITGNREIALKFGSLLSQYYRDIESNIIEDIAV